MSIWSVLYIVAGFFAWPLIASMLFHCVQGSFPRIAAKVRRSDMGLSLVFGLFYTLLWPISLPITYCLTGFAEHGILRQK